MNVSTPARTNRNQASFNKGAGKNVSSSVSPTRLTITEQTGTLDYNGQTLNGAVRVRHDKETPVNIPARRSMP